MPQNRLLPWLFSRFPVSNLTLIVNQARLAKICIYGSKNTHGGKAWNLEVTFCVCFLNVLQLTQTIVAAWTWRSFTEKTAILG